MAFFKQNIDDLDYRQLEEFLQRAGVHRRAVLALKGMDITMNATIFCDARAFANKFYMTSSTQQLYNNCLL